MKGVEKNYPNYNTVGHGSPNRHATCGRDSTFTPRTAVCRRFRFISTKSKHGKTEQTETDFAGPVLTATPTLPRWRVIEPTRRQHLPMKQKTKRAMRYPHTIPQPHAEVVILALQKRRPSRILFHGVEA